MFGRYDYEGRVMDSLGLRKQTPGFADSSLVLLSSTTPCLKANNNRSRVIILVKTRNYTNFRIIAAKD